MHKSLKRKYFSMAELITTVLRIRLCRKYILIVLAGKSQDL